MLRHTRLGIFILCLVTIQSCFSPIKKIGPFEDFIITGKFFYISSLSSTSKAWVELANSVAKNISESFKKYPTIRSKKIYILPGKDTVFEKSYRELLETALIKKNFIISETPNCDLVIKYNSYLIPNKDEVVVNTTLFDKTTVIFKDSSVFYLKDGSIYNYMIKLNVDTKQKFYHLVD